ncbi:MAG: hypothetical protein AUI85_08220 [Acidobacteriales bacterium 13_1_40CM_3_55_5]|nr:MAG: hypothetical protein AUI85_08220 [Acidobacteriales bacterium 13_1_40CM_3_55_5]
MLLDWNEIGVVMVCLLLFCAVAVKDWVPPRSLAATAAATRKGGDQNQAKNDSKRKKNRPTHSSSPPHVV